MAELFGEFVRDDTRRGVGDAAGGKRHDDADGVVGIVRLCQRGMRCAYGETGDQNGKDCRQKAPGGWDR